MQKFGNIGWITRPCLAGLLAGIAVLLMPVVVATPPEEETPDPLLPVTVVQPTQPPQPQSSATENSWDETQTIRLLTEDGTVEEMTMGEYLCRVVAAEMPATFEAEALRAQAVCARTYCLWKMTAGKHGAEGADICHNSACCQAYATPEELQARWGEQAKAFGEKIASAVEDTDGCILTYGGEPIQAAFFSSSAQSTEDAAAVWGGSLPYLVSVTSPEGEEVPNYQTTVTLSAEEVAGLAKEKGLGADLSGDPSGWISRVERTASGRVAELELGGVTLTGGAARSLFGLRSTCFSVEEKDGVFTFSVTGYGHGVGMSQYGANAMAKAGSGWEEIVQHYYTGVTVEKRTVP